MWREFVRQWADMAGNGMDPGGPHVRTLAEVRDHLGLGKNTLSDWRKRPGFPVNVNGTFPIGRIRDWREAWRSQSANRSDLALEHDIQVRDGVLTQERAAEQLKFRRLKNEHQEMRNRELGGTLIERSAVAELLAERGAWLRRKFMVELPRRAAPGDLAAQARIKEEVREILLEYTRDPGEL